MSGLQSGTPPGNSGRGVHLTSFPPSNSQDAIYIALVKETSILYSHFLVAVINSLF